MTAERTSSDIRAQSMGLKELPRQPSRLRAAIGRAIEWFIEGARDEFILQHERDRFDPAYVRREIARIVEQERAFTANDTGQGRRSTVLQKHREVLESHLAFLENRPAAGARRS